jgi:hypothetical protein
MMTRVNQQPRVHHEGMDGGWIKSVVSAFFTIKSQMPIIPNAYHSQLQPCKRLVTFDFTNQYLAIKYTPN